MFLPLLRLGTDEKGGVMSGLKHNLLPLSEALIIAEKVVDALQIACERVEVVGSVRRKRPQVHDVDLVVIPRGEWIRNKKGELEPFPNQNRWFEIPRLIKDIDGRIVKGNKAIITAVVDGFQVDINCAHKGNWGILQLIKTGPKEFNIELCNLARRLGKQLKTQSGIWQDGIRLPAQTEEQIFLSLGVKITPPIERDEAVCRLREGALV